MDFNDNRFGGRNDKDRTVPPEENYYADNDFNFDLNSSNNNGSYYNRYRSKNQNQFQYNEPPRQYNYNNANSFYNTDNGFSSSNDFLRDYEGRKAAEEFDRRPPVRKDRPSHNTPKKKKRKKNKLYYVIAALSALLALVLVVTATGLTALSKINYNEKTDNKYVNAADLKSSSGVKNILLLGVDARAGESGETSRADSMMLISIDSDNNCIKMTSFLRDTWVYIPCKDTRQRLNAACTYGGYEGVADTIEYNFGVKIDGYVVADFEMFETMVDCIGGVKIDVTEEEAKEVTGHQGRYSGVTLEAGEHKLTGAQALAYCRIRKIDTDWKRTERQRTVMEKIIKGVAKSPFSALSMITKIAPFIETNLTKSQIMNFAFKALGCISGGFEQESCPFDGTWEYTTKSGASVIGINVEKNKEKLSEFIYG